MLRHHQAASTTPGPSVFVQCSVFPFQLSEVMEASPDGFQCPVCYHKVYLGLKPSQNPFGNEQVRNACPHLSVPLAQGILTWRQRCHISIRTGPAQSVRTACSPSLQLHTALPGTTGTGTPVLQSIMRYGAHETTSASGHRNKGKNGTGIQSPSSAPASHFLHTEEPILDLQITHLHCKVRSSA